MSVRYKLVQWNRHKLIYDAILLGSVALFLLAFLAGGKLLAPQSAGDTELIIRGIGVCALVLLHVILLIGPLARLEPRLNPLLYNRRHLGVTMFLLALLHGILATVYFGGFGSQNPIAAVFLEPGAWWPPALWPFELFGLMALSILFVLASTSHDFWLKNLTPAVWKSLHMGVYVAYALLIAHVAFGSLQRPDGVIGPLLLGLGILLVSTTHLTAGLVQRQRDRAHRLSSGTSSDEQWVDAGPLADIPQTRAKRVILEDFTEIAVYRVGEAAYAVSNICPHQGGPLSEGQIVDGCITCPWHGYQFRPDTGASPPPYTDYIPTYPVRIEQNRVFVRTSAAHLSQQNYNSSDTHPNTDNACNHEIKP
jgi:methionine sulfoxide reductase heme-binding subunit